MLVPSLFGDLKKPVVVLTLKSRTLVVAYDCVGESAELRVQSSRLMHRFCRFFPLFLLMELGGLLGALKGSGDSPINLSYHFVGKIILFESAPVVIPEHFVALVRSTCKHVSFGKQ